MLLECCCFQARTLHSNCLDVFNLFVVQITIYECVFHAFKAATQLTPCILGVSIILLREARTEAVFHGLFMSSNLRMTFSNSKNPTKLVFGKPSNQAARLLFPWLACECDAFQSHSSLTQAVAWWDQGFISRRMVEVTVDVRSVSTRPTQPHSDFSVICAYVCVRRWKSFLTGNICSGLTFYLLRSVV